MVEVIQTHLSSLVRLHCLLEFYYLQVIDELQVFINKFWRKVFYGFEENEKLPSQPFIRTYA